MLKSLTHEVLVYGPLASLVIGVLSFKVLTDAHGRGSVCLRFLLVGIAA